MQSQVHAKRRKLKSNGDRTRAAAIVQTSLDKSRLGPLRVCIVLPLCIAVAACSGSPSVAVLGAYFPDWLFCIVGAVVLVACLHMLLRTRGREALLSPPVIVYPALLVLFAAALWAVGFNL